MEFKGTKGELERKYVSGICIGIGIVGEYSQITANSVLEHLENDDQYEKEKEEIEANLLLYSKSTEMLEILKKARLTISRLKNSMLAHPDWLAE